MARSYVPWHLHTVEPNSERNDADHRFPPVTRMMRAHSNGKAHLSVKAMSQRPFDCGRWPDSEVAAFIVATRLTEDQLIRQVLQGRLGTRPYGKNLSPAETTALVQFLETLHPINGAAAITEP